MLNILNLTSGDKIGKAPNLMLDGEEAKTTPIRKNELKCDYLLTI